MGMAVMLAALAITLPMEPTSGEVTGINPPDLTPVTTFPAPRHEPVPIVRDGKAVASVVMQVDNPSAGLRTAVQDLVSHIEQATGARLPVASEPGEGFSIVVRLEVEPPADAPVEGFWVHTMPKSVIISGYDMAGAQWGVIDFIERFVGVRWYWPEDHGGTSIIKMDSLSIPPARYVDAPAFRKREIWPSGGPRVAGARVGLHHQRMRSYDSWPTKLIVHAPHNWRQFYQDTRPEIFQLRKDGQRDWTMLCYGDPLTLDTYLERIAVDLKAQAAGEGIDRQTAVLLGDAVTVSPADIPVACECEDCMKLWDDDAGQYGTASRILGEFVANLGRAVKERWPHLTIIYLPYKNYTYAPEGVVFPDNVEVQICGMPGLAMYKDASINASEQANIDAWVELTGRPIQNWHYSCWPANRTEAAYVYARTARDHYVANRDTTVGTFINGLKDHWPRQHVSLYAWMKSLWNPEFDVDAFVDAFCERMYGPPPGRCAN